MAGTVAATLPNNPLFGGKPSAGLPANPVLSASPLTAPAPVKATPAHAEPNPFPITKPPAGAAGPSVVAAPVRGTREYAIEHGVIPHITAVTEKASAPTVAAYNRQSGGTQGVVPGMTAADLRQIRDMARANPRVAANWANIVSPIQWDIAAVHGVPQIASGAKQVLGGKASGLVGIGLGSLAVAGVLPLGRAGRIVSILGHDATAFREAAALAKGASTATEAAGAVHAANLAREAALSTVQQDKRFLKPDGTVSKWGTQRTNTIDRAHESIVAAAHAKVPNVLESPTEHKFLPLVGPSVDVSPHTVVPNLSERLKALGSQKTGQWQVEHLPNGFVRVHDRSSGLESLYDPTTQSLRSGAHILPDLNRISTARGAAAAVPIEHPAAAPGGLGALLADETGSVSLDRPRFLGGGLEHRTAAEAEAHLAPLMEQAKAEGWGGHVGSKGHPSIVEHGVSTPETGGALGQAVREALPHAAPVRDIQKGEMSAERSQRVRAAELASERAGGGTPGHFAALAELKGKYGRGAFPHIQHLTPEDVHTLNRHIDAAPLQFFEKTTAKDAVLNAVDHGVAPTEGEQMLLERAFGKLPEDAAASRPKTNLGEKIANVSNIQKAIRSSVDISMAFRQNIVTAVTHPNTFAKAFVKSARMFVDPAYHQAVMDEIHSDPMYPLLMKWSNGKLFSEIGATAEEGASLAKREDAFAGANIAERLNLRELPGLLKGKRWATGPGDLVRMSDRAFTGGLNYSRFMVGKQLAEKAAMMGHDLSNPKVGESIAKLLGTITGRGVVPKVLEGHLTTLIALLFSPRLIAARLNLLSPTYYYKLDPFARGEALVAARNMVATMGSVMAAAKMAGATVNFDPRSSNFGKIRVGNTRIDITGGFNQYIRMIAQEMTREVITSAGTHQRITTPFLEKAGARGTVTDLSNLTKYGRSKLAPVPGTLWDVFGGKNFIGQPVKPLSELGQNTPFLAQDIYDAKKVGASPPRVFAAAFLSAIGFGVQSYKDKPASGGGGGGGNAYDSGYGGGSSYDSGGYGGSSYDSGGSYGP